MIGEMEKNGDRTDASRTALGILQFKTTKRYWVEKGNLFSI